MVRRLRSLPVGHHARTDIGQDQETLRLFFVPREKVPAPFVQQIERLDGGERVQIGLLKGFH